MVGEDNKLIDYFKFYLNLSNFTDLKTHCNVFIKQPAALLTAVLNGACAWHRQGRLICKVNEC